MIYITIGILIITAIMIIFCRRQINKFEEGYLFAKHVFEENNFKHAIIFLEERLEESRIFHTSDEFDRGIEKGIAYSISKQICKLDELRGGDWYFDNESYSFKDSLSDREILL